MRLRAVDECLTRSIGIAPNAFLGKVGSDLQTPDGLTIITERKPIFKQRTHRVLVHPPHSVLAGAPSEGSPGWSGLCSATQIVVFAIRKHGTCRDRLLCYARFYFV